MTALFEPLTLGAVTTPHRVLMAPLTRMRPSDDYRRSLKAAHPGVIVGAGNYDVEKATRLLDAGLIDAAAFGRKFIANPDLPRRLAERLPLNAPVPDTFYGGDEAGYTDYPAHV